MLLRLIVFAVLVIMGRLAMMVRGSVMITRVRVRSRRARSFCWKSSAVAGLSLRRPAFATGRLDVPSPKPAVD